MGILVDTCFFIDLERGKKPEVLAMYAEEDFFISAVTLSELLLGWHLAKTSEIAKKRKHFIDKIANETTILDFNTEIAKLHAEYGAMLLQKNTPIGPHDLLIAATAQYYKYPLMTRNIREFSRLSELQIIPYQI